MWELWARSVVERRRTNCKQSGRRGARINNYYYYYYFANDFNNGYTTHNLGPESTCDHFGQWITQIQTSEGAHRIGLGIRGRCAVAIVWCIWRISSGCTLVHFTYSLSTFLSCTHKRSVSYRRREPNALLWWSALHATNDLHTVHSRDQPEKKRNINVALYEQRERTTAPRHTGHSRPSELFKFEKFCFSNFACFFPFAIATSSSSLLFLSHP